MPEHEKITAYLNAVIPEKIPTKRKRDIEEEYRCHIADRIEKYREIGYDEETSIEKALTDMGDAQPVRESIERLYRDRTVFAVALSLALLAATYAANTYGCIYASLDTADDPGTPHVFFSALVTFGLLLTILRAYQKRQRKTLLATGILMALYIPTTLLSSAIFQPLLYATVLMCYFFIEIIFGIPFGVDGTIYVDLAPVFFGSIGLMIAFCALSFWLYKKAARTVKLSVPPKRRRRPKLKTLAVLLALYTVFLTGVFYIASGYYGITEHWVTAYIRLDRAENSKALKLYRRIDSAATGDYVNSHFENNGYIPIETTADSIIYCRGERAEDSLCTEIEVSDTGKLPITFKNFLPVYESTLGNIFWTDDPQKCYACYTALKTGVTLDGALEQLSGNSRISDWQTVYNDEYTLDTVTFEARDIGDSPDTEPHVYVTLVFHNEALTQKNLYGSGCDEVYDYGELSD